MRNSKRPLIRMVLGLTLAMGGALFGLQSPAYAAFPGHNGRLLFTWEPDREVDTAEIATVRADGNGLRLAAGCDQACHYRSGDWSPNGRRLVYVDCFDTCRDRIVTRRPDGSDRKVVVGYGLYESPVWSPDGRRIAYIWYHRIHGTHRYADDIVVVHRDGTHRKQITHTKTFSESDLDWSSRNRLPSAGSARVWDSLVNCSRCGPTVRTCDD
jgi:hypothetical protein